jgi:hypothetical protein
MTENPHELFSQERGKGRGGRFHTNLGRPEVVERKLEQEINPSREFGREIKHILVNVRLSFNKSQYNFTLFVFDLVRATKKIR